MFKNLDYFGFKTEFEWLPKISPVSEEDFKDMTVSQVNPISNHFLSNFKLSDNKWNQFINSGKTGPQLNSITFETNSSNRVKFSCKTQQ